jgi:hypothetical protein
LLSQLATALGLVGPQVATTGVETGTGTPTVSINVDNTNPGENGVGVTSSAQSVLPPPPPYGFPATFPSGVPLASAPPYPWPYYPPPQMPLYPQATSHAVNDIASSPKKRRSKKVTLKVPSKKEKKSHKSISKPMDVDSEDERLQQSERAIEKLQKEQLIREKRERNRRRTVSIASQYLCTWRGGSNQSCDDKRLPGEDMCFKHLKKECELDGINFKHYMKAKEIIATKLTPKTRKKVIIEETDTEGEDIGAESPRSDEEDERESDREFMTPDQSDVENNNSGLDL